MDDIPSDEPKLLLKGPRHRLTIQVAISHTSPVLGQLCDVCDEPICVGDHYVSPGSGGVRHEQCEQ